jgi:hypothetical protein
MLDEPVDWTCWYSNGKVFEIKPTSRLCMNGALPAVTIWDGVYTWSCPWYGWQATSCEAYQTWIYNWNEPKIEQIYTYFSDNCQSLNQPDLLIKFGDNTWIVMAWCNIDKTSTAYKIQWYNWNLYTNTNAQNACTEKWRRLPTIDEWRKMINTWLITGSKSSNEKFPFNTPLNLLKWGAYSSTSWDGTLYSTPWVDWFYWSTNSTSNNFAFRFENHDGNYYLIANSSGYWWTWVYAGSARCVKWDPITWVKLNWECWEANDWTFVTLQSGDYNLCKYGVAASNFKLTSWKWTWNCAWFSWTTASCSATQQ